MRCGEIFADSDRGARTAAAPQIVSCCRNGNRPVSLRELHVDEAREYLERSKQKSRKTYSGYRTAVNLFAQSCKGRISMRSAGTTCSTTCTASLPLPGGCFRALKELEYGAAT